MPDHAPRQALGRMGEELAAAFLLRHGYRILGTNVRTRLGEIDIIAEDRSASALVFVEVKTRRGSRFGSPAEAVDLRKQRRLARLAEAWLQQHPHHANRTCRFDVIGVLVNARDEADIDHIPAAFQSS